MERTITLIDNYKKKLNEQVSKMKPKDAFVTGYQLYTICNAMLNLMIKVKGTPVWKNTPSLIMDEACTYTTILRAYLEQESKQGVTNLTSGTNLIVEEILNRIYGPIFSDSYADPNILTDLIYQDECSAEVIVDLYGNDDLIIKPRPMAKIPVVSLISRFVSSDTNELVPLSKFRLSTITKNRLSLLNLKQLDKYESGDRRIFYKSTLLSPNILNPYIELTRLYKGTDERSFFTLITMYSEKIQDSLKGNYTK